MASSVNHFSGEQRLSRGESMRMEIIDGVRFVWIRTWAHQGNGLRRIAGMVAYSLKARGRRALDGCPRPDVVVGSSVHPGAGVAAASIARRFRIPFLFEVRDLWPETLIAFGAIGERSLPARILRRLERWLYVRATRIITVLPGAVDYISALGVDPDKVSWIPNGVSTTGSGESRCPSGAGLKIHYVGSLGTANAMECVIDAMKVVQMSRSVEQIELHLFGDGPCRHVLEARAHEQGVTSVFFHGAISKSEVPRCLAEADALIISVLSLPRLYRFGISMNKVYDYLEAGRPVLAAIEARNNPVSESGGGMVVPPGDPVRLAHAIVAMASLDAHEREALGAKGRKWVREHNDFDVLARKLESVLRRAINEHASR
jgi:glycosyltransferase involved in cell wall biosynthesis